MADLSNEIETAAGTPKKHAVDGESTEARSIDELIKADRYLAAKNATAKKKGGLRFGKLIPPSASGTPSTD